MKGARYDASSLGNLALANDLVSLDTLRRVVSIQRDTGKCIGCVLVETGALTHTQLDRLLAQQERIRSGQPTMHDVRAMADYAVSCVGRMADSLTQVARLSS